MNINFIKKTFILYFLISLSLQNSNLIDKQAKNSNLNATDAPVSDVFNFEIVPKAGDIKTMYGMHLEYPCDKYPLDINLDLEFFDPLTEKSLYIKLNYLNFKTINCEEKIKYFRLIPLPDRILETLKTDYVHLDYYITVKNTKGHVKNLLQKGNEYKITKKSDDVIPFDIHNNPVRDNKEKVDKYVKKNLIEKKAILNETIKNLTEEENKDENLQTSILISQYILSTKCEPNLLLEEYRSQINREQYNYLINSVLENNRNFNNTKHMVSSDSNEFKNISLLLSDDLDGELTLSKLLADDCTNSLTNSLEKSMQNLIENFECEIVEKLISNQTNPNNTIILAALSVLYPSFGNVIFSEESFKNHFTMSSCLTTHGLSLLNKYNSTTKDQITNLSEDFMRSIFLTASNILDTLSKNSRFSNRTFNDKFSLIINEETQNTKALIENQELLFLNNHFNNKNKVKSNNLIYFYEKLQRRKMLKNEFDIKLDTDSNRNLSDNNYKNNEIYRNFSLQYEKIDTPIIVSLPVDHILEKYNLNEVFVSAINYKNYPLLKNSNKTYSDDVISIKIIDAIKNKIVDVDHLEDEFPIKIYLKKNEKSLNTCLFYDDELKIWNDFKCKNSAESSSEYLICNCFHLTDFSFSIINPVDVYKDFIAILTDIRFINDLRDFRFANFSNAGVLYMFLAFFLLLILGLFILLRRELNVNIKSDDEKAVEIFNDNFFYFYYNDDEDLIIKRFFNREAMDRNIKIQIRKLNTKLKAEDRILSDDENKIIIESDCETTPNLNLISDDLGYQSPNAQIKDKDSTLKETKIINYTKFHTNQICDSSDKNLCLIDKRPQNNLLAKFFKKFFYSFSIVAFEYRIVSLFSQKPFVMNRFSILFILFFDTINFISISSLISPNNSLSGDPKKTAFGYIYLDRKIAIYFITILLCKIPRIVLAVMIKKFAIERNTDEKQLEKKKQTIFTKYCCVYVFILLFYVFFLINTFWISMNNVKHKRSNDFIYNFLISLFIKYVWIFIFIVIKSILLLCFSNFSKRNMNLIYLINLNIYTLIP